MTKTSAKQQVGHGKQGQRKMPPVLTMLGTGVGVGLLTKAFPALGENFVVNPITVSISLRCHLIILLN